jgi:DNA (cytosine-5)-methyltransferase 1
VREDLQIEPTHPKPLPYRYTMREAFGNGNGNGIDGEHRKLNPGTKLFRLWQWSKQNKTTYFDKAHESIFGTNSMFSHCRTNFDAPCPTVCQGATSLYHEEIPRTLTVPELKKIASFPDDFQFIGSFNQTWERIGNCVPPLMMKCIAEVVRAEILQKIDSKGVDKHSVK